MENLKENLPLIVGVLVCLAVIFVYYYFYKERMSSKKKTRRAYDSDSDDESESVDDIIGDIERQQANNKKM